MNKYLEGKPVVTPVSFKGSVTQPGRPELVTTIQAGYVASFRSPKAQKVQGSRRRFNDARNGNGFYVTPHTAFRLQSSKPVYDVVVEVTTRDYYTKRINLIRRHNRSNNVGDFISPKAVTQAVKYALEQSAYSREELLTSATARANERDWDLLTELGEVPETLRMFYEAYKGLRKPLEALRSITNAQRRSRVIRHKEPVLDKRGRPVKDKKTGLNKFRIRREKQYYWKNDWWRPAELVAEAWLLYRYGIMPIYYSVQDIAKVLTKPDPKGAIETVKQRELTTVNESIQMGYLHEESNARIPVFWDLDVKLSQRVCIKTLFTAEQLKKRKLQINPVATAWELTTLSFVVDWLVHVGDYIMALSPVNYTCRSITYSEKIEGTIRTRLGEPSASNDIRVINKKLEFEVNFQQYHREVVSDNALNFITLPIGLETSWKRQVDALALVFPVIRKLASGVNLNFLRKAH